MWGGVYCAVPNNPNSCPSHVLPFTPLPTNPTVCKWEGSVHRRSIKTVISLTVSLTYNLCGSSRFSRLDRGVSADSVDSPQS